MALGDRKIECNIVLKEKYNILKMLLLGIATLYFSESISQQIIPKFSISIRQFNEIENTLLLSLILLLGFYGYLIRRGAEIRYKIHRSLYYMNAYLWILYIVLEVHTEVHFYIIVHRILPISYIGALLFFLSLGFVILAILSKKHYSKKVAPSFLQQDIAKDGSQDIRNEYYAKELIEDIKGFYPQKAFIISISAPWGRGKTSFINRVRFLIDEEYTEDIIIEFKPWEYHGENAITQIFFELLSTEISKYDGNASRQIKSYVNSILEIEEGFLGKVAQLDIFSEKQPTGFDDLNMIIKNLNRRIFVFIDDLERSSASEIQETLGLLRSSANFNNLFFICATDRLYMERSASLEPNFFNKIFNLEIKLPTHKESFFIIELKRLINSTEETILDSRNKKELCNVFDDTDQAQQYRQKSILSKKIAVTRIKLNDNEYGNYGLEKFTPSLFFDSTRDVKRFYNQLIFNIRILLHLEGNTHKLKCVDLYDYVLFQLLIYKYPWMQEMFIGQEFQNWARICNDNKFIVLKHLDDPISDLKKGEHVTPMSYADPIISTDESVINHFLQNFYELSNASPIEKQTFYAVINELFSINGHSPQSICLRRNLQIYLNNNSLGGNISYTRVLNELELRSLDTLIQEIKEDYREDKKSYLESIWEVIMNSPNSFPPSKDTFIHIIELINTTELEDYCSLRSLEYLLDQWLHYFRGTEDDLSSLLNESIFTKLNNSTGKFLLEINSMLSYLIDDQMSSEIIGFRSSQLSEFITEEYVVDRVTELYEIMCSDHNISHKEKYSYLQFCVRYSEKEYNFYPYHPRAKKAYLDYITKYPKAFADLITSRNEYFTDFKDKVRTFLFAKETIIETMFKQDSQ